MDLLERKYTILLEKYRLLQIEYDKLRESEMTLQKEAEFFRSKIPILKNVILELIK